jgi:hypothetical protein
MDDALGTADESGREQFVRHRPAPVRADADVGVAARWVGWVTSLVVMSCRTRMAHVVVDGAAAVRAPALCRHNPGRHRVHGRSVDGCDHGSSPALADLGLVLRAKHGIAPALLREYCAGGRVPAGGVINQAGWWRAYQSLSSGSARCIQSLLRPADRTESGRGVAVQ